MHYFTALHDYVCDRLSFVPLHPCLMAAESFQTVWVDTARPPCTYQWISDAASLPQVFKKIADEVFELRAAVPRTAR